MKHLNKELSTMPAYIFNRISIHTYRMEMKIVEYLYINNSLI